MSVFPEIEINRIAVKLKTAAEKMVKKGHPWVFENSIIKQNQKGKPGDLAIIYDSKKNKVIAIGLFDPDSPIRIKIIQFNKPAIIDGNWFLNTIQNAYAIRAPLLKTETNSYRLIFGENDYMPGCIADVYDHVLVIKLYAAIWFPYLSIIVPQLIEVSACSVVVLRLSRSLQISNTTFNLKDGQVIYGTLDDEVVLFKEHGISFSANVIKGHKTGYFLDHRHNRKMVGQASKNKKVLDVFAYAGGFSAHAIAGGASEVLSIDISEHALQMAKKNVSLNSGLGTHTVLATDAFEGLKELKNAKNTYDIVIIDPPSFAKRESEIAGAKNSYARLTRLGAALVKKGGLLIMASCSSRVSSEDFFEIVEENIEAANRTFVLMQTTAHDIDHPVRFLQGAYLKCGYYKLM